jgi:hypothetical protein
MHVRVVPINPSLLEHFWEAVNSMTKERRENAAIGVGAFGVCIPEAMSLTVEQHVAMMVRSTLLSALVERGILDQYMQDKSQRKAIFATVASMPCDKNDLSEVLAYKLLLDAPREVAVEREREMREAGYDPDHPKVGEKLLSWMREHS